MGDEGVYVGGEYGPGELFSEARIERGVLALEGVSPEGRSYREQVLAVLRAVQVDEAYGEDDCGQALNPRVECLASGLWAFEGLPSVDWATVVERFPSEARRVRGKAYVLLVLVDGLKMMPKWTGVGGGRVG